ncbi:MAG: hypothetical protein WBE72_11315 [Terracidiphilus sp.]
MINARPAVHPWQLRDGIAAAGLFLATAGVILWQNAHLVVLWDFSYVLDSAVRIADGQMPYRDFPFAHAPLTFLIQAAIVRLAGRVFFHSVLYAALVGAASTVLAWRIALAMLRERLAAAWTDAAAWTVALLLALPLTVVGIYCILPLPNYDCDCAFSILAALWLLQRLAQAHPSRNYKDAARVGHPNLLTAGNLLSGFVAGASACLPVFFKQNMGLAFLLAVAGAIALILSMRLVAGRRARDAENPDAAALWAALAGVGATLAAAAMILHFTACIGNYLDWTIQFAAQRRLPGFGDMLGVYHDSKLLWTLPCVAAGLLLLRGGKAGQWAPHSRRVFVFATRVGFAFQRRRILAFVLLAAPFVFTLCSLWLYDDADERGDTLLALWPLLLILAATLAMANLFRLGRGINLRALLPVVLLAAMHGTMMSQQLWGSTYAIWPLLILLIAELVAFLARLAPPDAVRRARFFVPALAALVSVTLLVCGGFYTASEERLSYAQFPDGPVERSAFPELAGMATPGTYLPDFDQLLRYAEANIPIDDGLILVPGEDPFYFATGRVPRFPVLLFDPTTDPYSPAEIAQLVETRRIRWLIVKRDLQLKEDPTPQRDATMGALKAEFTPAAHLRGYDVYRR